MLLSPWTWLEQHWDMAAHLRAHPSQDPPPSNGEGLSHVMLGMSQNGLRGKQGDMRGDGRPEQNSQLGFPSTLFITVSNLPISFFNPYSAEHFEKNKKKLWNTWLINFHYIKLQIINNPFEDDYNHWTGLTVLRVFSNNSSKTNEQSEITMPKTEMHVIHAVCYGRYPIPYILSC